MEVNEMLDEAYRAVKIAKDTTPMARKAIKGKEQILIANAEPKEAVAHFGYSDGWTCRIRLNRRDIGEAHHMFTITGALTQAILDMRRREKHGDHEPDCPCRLDSTIQHVPVQS